MVIEFSYARKQWRLALRAMVMVALVAPGGCQQGGGSTQSATAPRVSAPGTRARVEREAADLENIDLSSLLSEIPEYAGQGRNLFAYGATRTAPPTRPIAPPSDPTPAPVTPPPQPTTPAPRVDLQFAGYVEKPAPGGSKTKYAVLLDGQEILTGAEGELVGNRYQIVQIGLESVTIRVEGTRTTQRIPLRTN